MNEEFVENFTSDGELTPIDIVAEITGLTYDEIRSCSKIVRVPQHCTQRDAGSGLFSNSFQPESSIETE